MHRATSHLCRKVPCAFKQNTSFRSSLIPQTGLQRRVGYRRLGDAVPQVKTEYSPLTLGAIGLTGGTFGALMGLGGGVVVVPLLTTFTSMTQKSAIGTSLVTALVIGGVGAGSYWSEGMVDIVNALAIAAGSSVTAVIGARFAQGLSDKTLKRVLGIYMLFMAAAVPLRNALLKDVWSAKAKDDSKSQVQPIQDRLASLDISELGIFATTGLFAGVASGLFGIAGGTIVTPTLAIFSTLSQPQVLGTSLTAGLIPSLLAARSFNKGGNIAWKAVPPIILGAAAGAACGSRLALKLSDEQLRWTFSGGMVILGLRVLHQAR